MWTRETYEIEMAERITHAAATMREANRKCEEIQRKHALASQCRRDPEWRTWDGKRGYAANEIIVLVRGMKQLGYDTDPKTLGETLMEKYRTLLRNEKRGQKPSPMIFIPYAWLQGLNLPEAIAIAPTAWAEYLAQFKRAS